MLLQQSMETGSCRGDCNGEDFILQCSDLGKGCFEGIHVFSLHKQNPQTCLGSGVVVLTRGLERAAVSPISTPLPGIHVDPVVWGSGWPAPNHLDRPRDLSMESLLFACGCIHPCCSKALGQLQIKLIPASQEDAGTSSSSFHPKSISSLAADRIFGLPSMCADSCSATIALCWGNLLTPGAPGSRAAGSSPCGEAQIPGEGQDG